MLSHSFIVISPRFWNSLEVLLLREILALFDHIVGPERSWNQIHRLFLLLQLEESQPLFFFPLLLEQPLLPQLFVVISSLRALRHQIGVTVVSAIHSATKVESPFWGFLSGLLDIRDAPEVPCKNQRCETSFLIYFLLRSGVHFIFN